MKAEVIEGESVEVASEPTRAVVVQQPGQAIITADSPTGPLDMLERATVIATALAKMIEAQHLYTVIQGRKFPQVEAWMTVGRMDNVVAREASRPIRNEDGSWEADVELVRLSDGQVIGNGSAMCGGVGDKPWDNRPAHQRRSMAVTRATSRAFRQQYSWIMALAGYEPTPSDEMPPQDDRDEPTHADGLIGTVITSGTQDYQLREGPDGAVLPFRLKAGAKSVICLAEGDLATVLATFQESVVGARVTVWGRFSDESFEDRKAQRTVNYRVLHIERIQTPDFTLPAPDGASPVPDVSDPPGHLEAGPADAPFDMAEVDREAVKP